LPDIACNTIVIILSRQQCQCIDLAAAVVITLSICRRIVPSLKKFGFLASTTM